MKKISKKSLERLIRRKYPLWERKAKKNNEYLINNLILHQGRYNLIKDLEISKQKLEDKLKSVQHTHLVGNTHYDEYDSEGIKHLTTRQLLRVYLILENLEDKEFKQKIGLLLEEDLKDLYAEHGGLILFDKNGKLIFYPIKSGNISNKKENTYYYDNTMLSFSILHIASYHFHAMKEDSSNSAGPSIEDILHCNYEANIEGESHNIVVTKLNGSRFNMDYCGGEDKDIEADPYSFSGFKIIDLGNYEY